MDRTENVFTIRFYNQVKVFEIFCYEYLGG